MLKLAMILNNAGERAAQTRYRDPAVLGQLGYNGLVVWETTGVSGITSPYDVGAGEMRRWVERLIEQTCQVVDQARNAGLSVYITYDVLSLPRLVVDGRRDDMLCKQRPNLLCPASDVTMQQSVDALSALMGQLPPVDGVVLRIGDSDGSRLPYLIGNDIYLPYCPRCSELGKADRVCRFVQAFYDSIVTRHGKTLIVRAWNVRPGGMHDSPELCERLRDRLPGMNRDGTFDSRLILSFKFTETDFWRYQRWNPASLALGDRPIMYELQCQREFEGKGSGPNWQAPLWRDGPKPPEVSGDDARAKGLAAVASQVNLAGLWAWVRGGGWGGPFVADETWIDANARAVPMLADDPATDLHVIADDWIAAVAPSGDDALACALYDLLSDSPDVVREGFYVCPFARTRRGAWHPNGDWIQDDLIDAEAAWRMVQQIEDDQLDEVVAEKTRALDTFVGHRTRLQSFAIGKNKKPLEPLINSLLSVEALLHVLRDLMAGLVAYRRFMHDTNSSQASELADECRQAMRSSQLYWQHHTQRYATLPGAATAFRETNLWELTQRILDELAVTAEG